MGLFGRFLLFEVLFVLLSKVIVDRFDLFIGEVVPWHDLVITVDALDHFRERGFTYV